jgi:undecaprenol kinase
VVDLVTEQYHPLAKQAKDIAAGAVLIYAILSVLIGIIIFFPKILVLIQR